jgi:outer membrane protein TolC
MTVFGTAWTFTLAFKPQQAPKPHASHKTAIKSPIVQPTMSQPLTNSLKQSHQPLKQEVAIAKHPVKVIPTSSDSKNVSLALYRLLSQHDIQHEDTTRQGHFRGHGDTETQRHGDFFSPTSGDIYAFLFTKAPTLGVFASGNTALSPAFDYRPKGDRNSQAVGLQTSCDLTLLAAMALKRDRDLENQPTHTIGKGFAQAQLPEGQQVELVTDTSSTLNQPQPASKTREVRLTLSDIIILALENNRPLKNAYLERIAQRQDLAVAEDKFTPNFSPTVSISIAQFGTNQTTTDANVGLRATVSVKVPTGGELSFGWATNGQTISQNGLNHNLNDDPFAQNLQLSFNQPLLRGYRDNVNRASIDIARLTEQINILDLKSTLIDTITAAIVAYRELIRAQEQLKIAQLSLRRAQESLANNRFLIEAGRLAPVDIVQSETEVARRQVSLVEADNNLEAARLALLNILDIDQTTVILAAEPLRVSAVTLNRDKLRQLAFENQPNYLKAQLDLERTKLALLQAKNNRPWDLNLNTSYGYASNNITDLRIELALSRTIGDLTVEREVQRSLVNQLKADNTLKEQRESLELELTDKIRDVNLSFSQVELAKKVTESSERQLEIAREKQRLGRDVTVFELVRFQDDLVQARNVELNAIINYLNALTRLDKTLGTTLDTWQVTIEKK